MRRALVLIPLLLLAVWGCNPKQEAIKWPKRSKTYTTIASLSPSTTEIAASMAFSVKLVGRTASDNFPPSVMGTKAPDGSPTSPGIPIVAQVKPDYEKLKAANPGLIVYDAGIYNDQDIQQIKALGIDTFEFKAMTVEGFEKEVMQFGQKLAVESMASEYVDKIEGEARAAQAEKLNPVPKVAFLIPGPNGQHMIAGTKSFQADVVRLCGGTLVGPDADRFVPINEEELIQLNPDMILTAGAPEPLMGDARLKSLTAIAKVHVRGLDQDIAVRRGYRVQNFISLTSRALQSMAGGK